jgi:predicted nucleotidyltransferase
MVAMREIRESCRRIRVEFKPRRIILFGSYAYGTPTEESDVDLLVVTTYRGHPVHKAIEIRQRVSAPFALDLIVRSPREIQRRYQLNDWFIREIVDKGRILYDATDKRMARQGRG